MTAARFHEIAEHAACAALMAECTVKPSQLSSLKSLP